MWHHPTDAPPHHIRWEPPVKGAFLGVGESPLPLEVFEFQFIPKQRPRDVDQLASDKGDPLAIEDLLGDVGRQSSFQVVFSVYDDFLLKHCYLIGSVKYLYKCLGGYYIAKAYNEIELSDIFIEKLVYIIKGEEGFNYE